MGLLAEDPAREARVCSFTGVVCATCPAIEELTAKDAAIAALGEENDALRAKVAALAEIAFGGSERRGDQGRDDAGDLEDLDDDVPGDGAGPGDAPGPSSGAGGDESGDGAQGAKGRRGQQRGSRGHGRRRYDHLEVRVVVCDLDEAERCCGCCGRLYETIAGDEVSSQIS
jgi:hypothetical protein